MFPSLSPLSDSIITPCGDYPTGIYYEYKLKAFWHYLLLCKDVAYGLIILASVVAISWIDIAKFMFRDSAMLATFWGAIIWPPVLIFINRLVPVTHVITGVVMKGVQSFKNLSLVKSSDNTPEYLKNFITSSATYKEQLERLEIDIYGISYAHPGHKLCREVQRHKERFYGASLLYRVVFCYTYAFLWIQDIYAQWMLKTGVNMFYKTHPIEASQRPSLSVEQRKSKAIQRYLNEERLLEEQLHQALERNEEELIEYLKSRKLVGEWLERLSVDNKISQLKMAIHIQHIIMLLEENWDNEAKILKIIKQYLRAVDSLRILNSIRGFSEDSREIRLAELIKENLPPDLSIRSSQLGLQKPPEKPTILRGIATIGATSITSCLIGIAIFCMFATGFLSLTGAMALAPPLAAVLLAFSLTGFILTTFRPMREFLLNLFNVKNYDKEYVKYLKDLKYSYNEVGHLYDKKFQNAQVATLTVELFNQQQHIPARQRGGSFSRLVLYIHDRKTREDRPCSRKHRVPRQIRNFGK